MIKRRICPEAIAGPDCYRGLCACCNSYDFVSIEVIEMWADDSGRGRDFLAGRLSGFVIAEVMHM